MTNSLRRTATAGFTLIETLVAVLILATAVAGPLTIASKGLHSALIAKDQTIALFLAQDALEYVRFKRDSNALAGVSPWLTGLDACVSTDGSVACYLDSLEQHPTVPTACASPSTCPVMNYDQTSGTFQYTNGTPSFFRREVQVVTPGSSTTEAQVIVTVSWSDMGGVTHSIIVRENIFHWQ